MYLSRLQLNPRSHSVQKDLADRHELHRTVLHAFPEQLSSDERVLFRVETSTRSIILLVQSQFLPDWSFFKAGDLLTFPQVRMVNTQHIHNGQTLMFRLLANPTFKQGGKRHALYQEEQCSSWLSRKGELHGFQVDDTSFRHNILGKIYGKKYQQVWHGVQFDGVLQVQDHQLFSQSIVNGIGSAKAFGFGLLSVPYPTL